MALYFINMNFDVSTTWLTVIFLLAIWDLVWKSIALWRAARNSATGWFIALVLVNSAGVLPIIYILKTNRQSRNKAK